ncbi:carbohydrate ABC transporter permease [Bacillus solitudinis]|uniref:carbohydrate ABC transporter permease n=1 Tax=Bacillus solitudinis TaxID=2014074 RepID=UPI000C23B134|nr:sugar ABC transporter permease [Bacillus solitudinis]
MERLLRDRKAILLFVGPALLLYTLVLFIPIVWSTSYSFFSGSPIKGFEFVGLDNYKQLFGDKTFLKSLEFSIKYTVIVSIGQVFMGLMLALLFVFYLKKTSFIVRTMVFFPVVLPTVAVAQMFGKIFEIAPRYGLVNALFESLQLDFLIQPWLGQASTAFWIIAVMEIWKAMGFYAVILFAGLLDIPDEILEAAKLDGAKGFNLLRFVITPLIKPIIFASMIFSLNGALKVYDSVVALTNGGPGNSTTPLTLYMYVTSFRFNEYGYGSTIAVILMLISLFITLFIYSFNRKE